MTAWAITLCASCAWTFRTGPWGPMAERAPVSATRSRRAQLLCAADGAAPSKRAEQFGAMLQRCREYTAEDIDGLRGTPRLQQLVRGVIRGTDDETVVRAFVVLYEDFLPLRLGGDLIFKILDDQVRAARRGAPAKGAPAGPAPAAADEGDELAQLKELFAAIDADGSGELSRDELVGSGFVELLRDYYGVRELDALFGGGAAEAESGELSLGRFIAAASKLGALDDAVALRTAVLENRARGERALERRRKHGARYDEMLSTFERWREAGLEQALLDSVENERLRAVLEGCFAGARNEGMVVALRVLYEDYAPLRMGGDLIWQVVQRIVAGADVDEPAPRGGGAAAEQGAS